MRRRVAEARKVLVPIEGVHPSAEPRARKPGSPEAGSRKPEAGSLEPEPSHRLVGAAGRPPRPQGDAQPDISASCSHIRPPAVHGRLWTSPCVHGGPRAVVAFPEEINGEERQTVVPGLPAWRLCRRCRHGATAGVEAVSRLLTSKRNCRTHEAGMSAQGDACTTAVDFRAGAGGCPGPSRSPGGVLPAGHGWPAAGRGSRTRTPAGGAHPPVRATGSATPKEAPNRRPALQDSGVAPQPSHGDEREQRPRVQDGRRARSHFSPTTSPGVGKEPEEATAIFLPG